MSSSNCFTRERWLRKGRKFKRDGGSWDEIWNAQLWKVWVNISSLNADFKGADIGGKEENMTNTKTLQGLWKMWKTKRDAFSYSNKSMIKNFLLVVDGVMQTEGRQQRLFKFNSDFVSSRRMVLSLDRWEHKYVICDWNMRWIVSLIG